MIPEGFVYLSDICPAVVQDIRYATSNNFTGKELDGYNKGVAILTLEAATQLSFVQKELQQKNIRNCFQNQN